jgi:hypothetical protein
MLETPILRQKQNVSSYLAPPPPPPHSCSACIYSSSRYSQLQKKIVPTRRETLPRNFLKYFIYVADVDINIGTTQFVCFALYSL